MKKHKKSITIKELKLKVKKSKELLQKARLLKYKVEEIIERKSLEDFNFDVS